MSTKLSRYCEGIMEAAWLAAVVLIPVFFNIYSSRIFEPDKITLLRTLAFVILGAWIVKLVDEGGGLWDRLERGDSWFKSLTRIPLLAPVAAMAVVYVIANIFSVTPRVSLWGSYQRLQGTYTTLSYMVIFAAIVGNLRKRAQVERIITAVILSSLPVSLYGILQKYEIDPVPWGGNVTNRIASNMGNSIFVAAYLIMTVPLTIGRIVQSFSAILKEEERLTSHVIRATLYVFIGAVELIAIYMSGSRGPLLGLLAGLFFLFVLLSLHWRKRWLTFLSIGGAAVIGLFLVLLNIPGGPLEALRDAPWIGRFGQAFDTDQRTSRVRILIWQGASDLINFHDPLVFPDGDNDAFNFMRPLIGYGPESMYVAYNEFYPPELGRVEKRNASPDRSHNETWDSLVTTGVIGFAAYVVLFASIFYYGLKWLGLVKGTRQRNLFLGLYLGSGVIGGIGFALWQGVEFIGVGIPFGIILGVIAYLTLVAIFSSIEEAEQDSSQALLLIVLLAAVVAHFVEINFGIAIVATRTHFWVYTALILVVGYILPKHGVYEVAQAVSQDLVEVEPEKIERKRSKKGKGKFRRRGRAPLVGRQPAWRRTALVGAIVTSFILIGLGYDFVSNAGGSTSALNIIANSMTRLPNKDNAVSFGVLTLVLTTWLAAVTLVTFENDQVEDSTSRVNSYFTTLGISAGIIFLFWLLHASSLSALQRSAAALSNQNDVINQVGNIGSLLTRFYVYIFMAIFGLAFFLPEEWKTKSSSAMGPVAAIGVSIVVLLMVNFTNLRVIHADIAFKMAEPFTKSDQWPVATILYQHALDLAPDEDHYYLFLGRSYLEQAKSVETPEDQEKLILQADADLKKAQRINPLNTDHTANLGRLFSWWASRAPDAATRQERGQIASDNYSMAVKLSPNNATLWGEWAILYMDILRQMDEAYQRLTHALELDDQYSWTQSLAGDYWMRIARSPDVETAAKMEAYNQAIYHYERAAEVATWRELSAKISYLVSLGNVHIEIANLDPTSADRTHIQSAIGAYEQAVELEPKKNDLWKIEETLAKLYAQMGDKTSALVHANAALTVVPENQQERILTLISQLETLP